MLQMFRFICFIPAVCIILNLLSFFAVQVRILTSDEQARLKEGKTFWVWDRQDGKANNIHYVEHGTGSNHVILIHGFRSNTFTWRHLMEPLSESGFHVWSMDLLGYGLSDKPDLTYDLDLFSEQIKAFLESMHITDAHFIGNSMGGGISLNIVLNHPEKVNSLTLISALGYPLELPLYISIGKYLSTLWAPFIGPGIIRKGLEQLVHDKSSILDEQVRAYALPYFLPGGSEAALSTIKNFDNRKIEALSKRYSEINCPLLVIWGDNDPLIPVKYFNQFCQDFPSAQKLLITDCGHIPQEEKSEQTLSTISKFLTGLE